jgi:hypothetical protein
VTEPTNQSEIRIEAVRRAASDGLKGLASALAAALEGSERELAACWVQEALVRGFPAVDVEGARQLWDQLRRENHPLAWLPLHLTNAESSIGGVLPDVSTSGSAYSPPDQPRARRELLPPTAFKVAEVVIPAARVAEVSAAVEGWGSASNGCFEVREFEVAPQVSELDVSVVAALDLESLRGKAEVAFESIDVASAFRVLFCAAANGGAYGGALWGAYGRLAAWRSLAGLAGVTPSTPVEAVLQTATRCAWASFFAPGWFQDVAWDLGLVVLRSDRLSICVLAATDTD